MTINTLELLNLLNALIRNNCDTATVAHGKFDGEPCLFISGNHLEKKTFDFPPILDANSPNAPKFFPVSADTPAPFVPSFGELLLTAEAFRTAAEHCESLQNDAMLSTDDKETVAFAGNTFKHSSDALDAFLEEYLGKPSK